MKLIFITLIVPIICAESVIQCSKSQTFCPSDATCCHAKYSPTTFGCQLSEQLPFIQQHVIRSNDNGEKKDLEPPHPTVSCCMPGPRFEPSNTLPKRFQFVHFHLNNEQPMPVM